MVSVAFARPGTVLWMVHATDAPLLVAFPVCYNAARLYLICDVPHYAVCCAGSTRNTASAVSRRHSPPPGTCRGQREPCAPLFSCGALRALPRPQRVSALRAHTLSTSFPPVFAAPPFRDRSPPRVLCGIWRVLRHILMWSRLPCARSTAYWNFFVLASHGD
jgi:hypothetical protein